VPGTIPVGTLIYHTGADKSLPTLPTIPEWAATDPEHSFLFCWGPNVENTSTANCWQLKLATTRPLTVLYFDGSSAAKVAEDGTLDVQDLLIWGKVDPARSRDDRARIDDLCAWGSELGIDGFVRFVSLTVNTRPVDLPTSGWRWTCKPAPHTPYMSFMQRM
jgi:hypothetical protein